MEHSVEGFLVFSIFIGLVTAIFWLFVKLVSFIWHSIFFETPTQYNVSAPYTNYISENSLSNEYIFENESISPIVKRKRVIAVDTEMVGGGERGSINMLARVSMVGLDGFVYDKYVKPVQRVTDYRTPFSGIRPHDLQNAEDYHMVLLEVFSILQHDCILVGHDLENDLRILGYYHPIEDIRDTALYRPFRKILADRYFSHKLGQMRSTMSRNDPFEDTMCYFRSEPQIDKIMNEKPSLKHLAKVILNRNIQVTEHSSLEDARAALDLYKFCLDSGEPWKEQRNNQEEPFGSHNLDLIR